MWPRLVSFARGSRGQLRPGGVGVAGGNHGQRWLSLEQGMTEDFHVPGMLI